MKNHSSTILPLLGISYIYGSPVHPHLPYATPSPLRPSLLGKQMGIHAEGCVPFERHDGDDDSVDNDDTENSDDSDDSMSGWNSQAESLSDTGNSVTEQHTYQGTTARPQFYTHILPIKANFILCLFREHDLRGFKYFL